MSQPKLAHIRSVRNEPSHQMIKSLVSLFPDISEVWLLTGQGSMLKSDNSTKRFEYFVETYDNFNQASQQRYLNDKAKGGWELISVVQFTDKDKTPCFRFYFRRETE